MDDTTLHMLKLFKERQELNLIQLGAILNVDVLSLGSPIRYLMDLGYICKGIEYKPTEGDLISPTTPLQITYKGEAAIRVEEDTRKRFRYSEFRAWVTLFIAIAALILSIISLILQI